MNISESQVPVNYFPKGLLDLLAGWQMFNDQHLVAVVYVGCALISRACWFPWCKYPQYTQFQGSNLHMDVGCDACVHLSWTSMSYLQHFIAYPLCWTMRINRYLGDWVLQYSLDQILYPGLGTKSGHSVTHTHTLTGTHTMTHGSR